MLYLLLLAALIETVWTCFGFYLSARAAWQAKRLTKTAIVLSILPLLVGVVTDVLLNVVASFAFLQLPKVWTLSQRVQSLVNTGTGWRKSLALWIGGLLNSLSFERPHITIPIPLPPLPAK